MTVKELYHSVAQLGFETSVENDERFFLAANRAILQVNRVRPATAVYPIRHFPLPNLLQENTFEPVCKHDEGLVFAAANAKSCYFECNGNGAALMEKQDENGHWQAFGEIPLSSPDRAFVAYRYLINGGDAPLSGWIRLRFVGDYIYYVQNIALYGELLGGAEKDVPAWGAYSVYDLSALVSDFAAFTKPPIVDARRQEGVVWNKDYFVEGASKLRLPSNVSGVFEVEYYKKPKRITSEGMAAEENVDLDDELCAILPNLVAGYVWIEDEPDKAQYYMSLYREQVSEIVARSKDMRPFVYRNKNGW